MKWIDLRSDTVTHPTAAMRDAMARADVGDDVYGEDPTVNALEALAAQRLGFAASLFVPSGTMSNLLALLTHCGRGDEYIAGQQAHTYKYEGGGGAVLGGIQPQPLPFQQDGTLDLDVVEATIKPDDFHFATHPPAVPGEHARRRAVAARLHVACSRVVRPSQACACISTARASSMRPIAQRVPVTQLTAGFDSVSVCLSKGLGAPVGSVLCGSEEFVRSARRSRKMLGGGMRQAGVARRGRHTRAESSRRAARPTIIAGPRDYPTRSADSTRSPDAFAARRTWCSSKSRRAN